MNETIKTYQGGDIGASQCLVTLEGFIGDMDNAELADDSTVDTSDAVTAINGLIWSLERREAEIERLKALVTDVVYAAQGDVRTTPDPIAVLSELGWFDKAKTELGMVPSPYSAGKRE